MSDIFDKKTRSHIMSRIRSQHTKPERVLRQALSGTYLRYHPKGIIGNPDFANKKHQIAVFVDGDFWHGYDWKQLGRAPPRGFWQRKIKRNMHRDNETARKLRYNGWKVVRFWEHQILNNPCKCAGKVKELVRSASYI